MTPAFDGLVSTPENPAPPGAEVVVIKTSDGAGLRLCHWPNTRDARGTVLILPGRSEFIEKYFETAAELILRGFAVVALDWRGQGGSERILSNPRKGHIDHFAIYRRDLDAALSFMQQRMCPRPWRGLAHSMGGAVLIDAAAHGETRLSRGILSAPMVGIPDVSPAGVQVLAVRALNLLGFGGLFLPGGRSRSPSAFDPFEGNQLTSDPVRYQRPASVLIAGPELAVGGPTIGWTAAAFSLLRAMQDPNFGLRSQCPLLFVTAGNDTIVSTAAAEQLASRMRGADAVHIPGSRHEIMMERDVFRQQFWAAFDTFMPG